MNRIFSGNLKLRLISTGLGYADLSNRIHQKKEAAIEIAAPLKCEFQSRL
jgi:hypothetical protein